ncbi:MAG: CehA/McbA family metallohydrolase [bacterium]
MAPVHRTRSERSSRARGPRGRRLFAGLVLVLALFGCGRKSPSGGKGPAHPHHPAGLFATLPSVALVGEPVTLRVAPLDSIGAPASSWSGRLDVSSADSAVVASGPFSGGDTGSFSCPIFFRTPGIHRVTVRSDAGDSAVAGPVRVVTTDEELRARPGEAARRLLWGDAHGHSNVGDGANPPDHYLYYGRDVAHLDYLCLSEHDFQQFLSVGLDVEAGSWQQIATLAKQWRRPGFAVLLGWEWSSREQGHRVILFPSDSTQYVSYRDVATPAALADALRGSGAVSVLAHPTGSELTPPINWDTVVPGFDRAIEIYSGHGGMDDTDFRPSTKPHDGHSALDALRRGLDLAFVAFSDTHLSTPGNPWPPPIRDAPFRGGLTAIWCSGGTEKDVLDGLAAGRCYATSGERFYVEFRANDRSLGETLVVAPTDRVRVHAFVAAAREVAWVELLASDRVLSRRNGGGADLTIDVDLGPFAEPTALWMRGASADGERFWTTPVRIVSP